MGAASFSSRHTHQPVEFFERRFLTLIVLASSERAGTERVRSPKTSTPYTKPSANLEGNSAVGAAASGRVSGPLSQHRFWRGHKVDIAGPVEYRRRP